MNIHERYMRAAIRLARKAEGMTSPNPIVGACVVRGGKIVGQGFHAMAGLPHAEVNALERAGVRAQGATLYVTLEPCDHFGRTPPCTNAIIKSGVKKVVIGMKDPCPVNDGRGIRKLKGHGIKTVVGVLEEEAMSINKPYIKYIKEGMPYVTVKVAESLDGKIATRTGDSRWITAPDARHRAHRLRSSVDAVMVGVTTVLRDDPRLVPYLIDRRPKTKDRRPRNTQYAIRNTKKLVRVIVDSSLRTPPRAKVLSYCRQSPLIIATTEGASGRKREALEGRGAEVLTVKSKRGRVDARRLLEKLAERGIMHILVEGGGTLIASLVEERLVDRFLFFIAPVIIGGKDAVTSVEGLGVGKVGESLSLKVLTVKRLARDILIETEAG